MSVASDWSAARPIRIWQCREVAESIRGYSSFNDSPYALVTLPRAVLTSLRSLRNSVLKNSILKTGIKLPFLIVANNNVKSFDKSIEKVEPRFKPKLGNTVSIFCRSSSFHRFKKLASVITQYKIA